LLAWNFGPENHVPRLNAASASWHQKVIFCRDGFDYGTIMTVKKRIYLETTVVSYLAAKPSRDIIVAGHQDATRELWPELSAKYETYISALVFEETNCRR
jgi:hypothetical protein